MNRLTLFTRLAGYMKRYFFVYLFGFVALILTDVTELYIPEQTGVVIDLLKLGSAAMQALPAAIGKILIFTLCVVCFRFIWRIALFGASRMIETDLRGRLYRHINTLSADFYTDNKTGDLMSYFTNDLDAIRMALGPGFLMVSDFVAMSLLIITRMIITTDPVLTLIACLPLPLIALGSLIVTGKLHNLFENKQEAFGMLSDITQETVSGIRVIKSFVQIRGAEKRFSKLNQKNMDSNVALINLEAVFMPLIQLITGFSFLLTLIYGGYLTAINRISLGEFVAFYEYLLLLIWPMIALGWSINIVSKGLSSVKRVEEIFQKKPSVQNQPDADAVLPGEYSITLKNLSFHYPGTHGNNFALHAINLHIDEGKILAITGKTGSGKTTLINLLERVFDPPENTLFIGGVDILKLKLATLRTLITPVPQDVFLFSDTISRNISMGSQQEREAGEIMGAAIQAGVHGNIIEFPEQYATVIGERGVTLSGGQKQRISIARALLRDTPILILDDSLSAVDTSTEKLIIDNLMEQRKGKTTIIIAHRISTIINADLIAVIDEGTLAECGTHEELLAKEGLYHELYERQQFEEKINE